MATNVPVIWHAPTTTDADRKQLIRQLIERVRLEVVGDSERVRVQITWAGGHHSDGELVRPVAALEQLSYYPTLAARVRELAAGGHAAGQIARCLNDEGFRPPKRNERFGEQGVRDCCGGWAASAAKNTPSAVPPRNLASTSGG